MKTLKIPENLQKVYFRKYVDIFALEDTSTDTYRKQLYANGRLLPKRFNELITQYKRQMNVSFSELSKEYNISEKQMRAWRTGRTALPLRALKQLTSELHINPQSLQKLIDGLSSSRGSTILIPRLISPTLVEILGRFCGDGSCGIYDGSNYKFSLKERNGNFVELHSQDMDKIFAIKGRVVHYPRVSENIIYSKPLVLLFQQLFKYKDGFQKSLHVKPPELLDDLDWGLRKGFTTGLIDTEGSFYYDQSTRTVIFEIKMINSSLIQEVGKAFKEFDVQHNYSSFPKDNPTIFRIRSYGKKTLRLLKDAFEPKNQRHLNQFQSLRL
jgi:DNA-binding transcriptional regulator YiaG